MSKQLRASAWLCMAAVGSMAAAKLWRRPPPPSRIQLTRPWPTVARASAFYSFFEKLHPAFKANALLTLVEKQLKYKWSIALYDTISLEVMHALDENLLYATSSS